MKRKIVPILFLIFTASAVAQWNTDRILNIGRNAYFFEDYVLSIQYFNQVIKVKPYLAEPYMYRGMAKISLGDFIGAEQDCNEAIELNPFIPYAYYTRGFARKNLMKFDEAIEDFTKALEFDPDNSNFVANRIEVKERKGDYEGAIEDLRVFKKMNPNAKGIDYEIGRILLSTNDTIAAEKMMEQTINTDSTMEMSYKLLAHIKEQRGDLDGALATLNQLKHINPRSENLELELGRIYLEQKDTVASLEAFNRAVYNDPNNSRAFGARAFLHMVMKQEDKALDDYSKAIEFGSNFAGDYINRGILNVKKYNFNQALNDYNYAILLDRRNSLAYYNRALLRNNLGDKNNALSDLDRVMELDPDNNEARFLHAGLQLELGYLDEAITNFENILMAYKYFAPAYYSLAEAYEKKGEFAKARNYRSLVFEIVNNIDYYKKKQTLEPRNKIVEATPTGNYTSTDFTLADKLSSQTENRFKKSEYEDSKLRGKIQENYTELQYLGDVSLSFEQTDSLITETNRFHALLQEFNRQAKLKRQLHILISGKTMSAGRINPHFEQIDELTEMISKQGKNRNYLYLARAVEYQTVQDYNSALEDIQTLLDADANNALAYFMRATIRKQMLTFDGYEDEPDTQSEHTIMKEEQRRIFVSSILADYDRAIELAPDFSFAYYNKANYLAELQEYREAVKYFSGAISIDPFFAEAYFGRGLTYIFINEDGPAGANLSKAGELGIYKAYNLLNRLHVKE